MDLIQDDSITITSDNVTKTITVGENHSVRTDNPHQVTPVQIGALVSTDGVSNPGGNVDFVQQNTITIAPDNVAKTITIGENHSGRNDNPHEVTATQTGALASVDGVSNPGGNVDFMAGVNMTITSDPVANTITFSAASPIKQVIRGVISFNSGEYQLSQSFSPSVDPSRSVVFLGDFVASGWAASSSYLPAGTGACLLSLGSSQITVQIGDYPTNWNWYPLKVSYQIIEYN